MTILEAACDQAPQWKKAKNGVGWLRHEIFRNFLDMFISRFYQRNNNVMLCSRHFNFAIFFCIAKFAKLTCRENLISFPEILVELTFIILLLKMFWDVSRL